MRYVADTNTFLAVALDEPEKPWLVKATRGHDLAAPAVLHYEIGNALSALIKRNAISAGQVAEAWVAATSIPVELVDVDLYAALALAARLGIYAYDAYFLQAAIQLGCPLLTLDRNLKCHAMNLNIDVVERP